MAFDPMIANDVFKMYRDAMSAGDDSFNRGVDLMLGGANKLTDALSKRNETILAKQRDTEKRAQGRVDMLEKFRLANALASQRAQLGDMNKAKQEYAQLYGLVGERQAATLGVPPIMPDDPTLANQYIGRMKSRVAADKLATMRNMQSQTALDEATGALDAFSVSDDIDTIDKVLGGGF